MSKIFKYLMILFAAALTACGGGGGSPGASSLPYTISVITTKAQLPINLSNQLPSIGAYSPFTTTLYVEAREGGAPILGAKEIFACNVAGGLESGALYYLDGKEEHMVEVDDGKGGKIKIDAAFRNIVLDSNSGGNSFHFHSGNKAGKVRITCSVTNPADKLVSSASVDIVVGAATGQAASVTVTTQGPRFLGTSDNTNNDPRSIAISAKVLDDANQPVPDPTAANLHIRIRPFGASAGARLLLGSQSGPVVVAKTIGGEGQFSISSGPSAGTILLELTADRFDNNVSNGIQDPVVQLAAISVRKGVASAPLKIIDFFSLFVTNGQAFSYALTATGGVPPYTWASSGLPAGLSLSADGIITGTPTAPSGNYSVTVTVTDSIDATVTTNLDIRVSGDLAIDGCDSNVGQPCQLPSATIGQTYSYTLSFSIGDPLVPVTWTITGNLPAGLALAADGTISGTPLAPAGKYTFIVTAKRGSLTVSRQVTIEVS